MNKKFKAFILCLCCVCFLVNFIFSKKSCAFVPAVAVGGGVVVTSEAIMALSACALIATGCVLYESLDSEDLRYIAEGMIQSGRAVNDFIVTVNAEGQRFLSFTLDGVKDFSQRIDSTDNTVIRDSSTIENYVNEYNVIEECTGAEFNAKYMIPGKVLFDIVCTGVPIQLSLTYEGNIVDGCSFVRDGMGDSCPYRWKCICVDFS